MMRLGKVRAKSLLAALLALVLALGLAGCGGGATEPGAQTEEPAEKSKVVIASTTSTEDTGLFEVMIPAFEKAYPQYDVDVVAVGTGQALEAGRNKDADVLLVHAKADEEKFVSDGFGTERTDVMYNDFILVGPKADPAGVKGGKDVAAALKAIADKESPFVSRGDDSGTHKKELSLWKAASVEPTASGDWYSETGQGMGETLKVATEKQGYTIADRGTWLAQESGLDLAIAVEGDQALFNQYGVIPVVGAKNPEGGKAFAEWVVSDEAQTLIKEFGVEEFGQSLFIPNAP